MPFANYQRMLNELEELQFESSDTAEFIRQSANHGGELTEAQLHEIVRLYNIYCIPDRWNNKQETYPQSKPKQRKKKRYE